MSVEEQMAKQTQPENQRSTDNQPITSGTPSANPRRMQRFGTLRFVPVGLPDATRQGSVETLNLVLANTIALRDLYKKCHWQIAGPTFYQLHLLFDKHYEEQSALVDGLAERVQTLGGVAIALAHDVAEHQTLGRAPIDAEDVPTMLGRLVESHMHILMQCRAGAKVADDSGDYGTNDLLVSQLVRTNELQVWFVNEHRIAMPLVVEGTTHASTRIPETGPTLHS
jgi:starvation-inducible DNA-binding protein